MRSPTLLPIRMNAADTRASSAIADWTPLTVVSRSRTTDEIETFISDVSTTRTNMAIARRIARRWLSDVSVVGADIRSCPECAAGRLEDQTHHDCNEHQVTEHLDHGDDPCGV